MGLQHLLSLSLTIPCKHRAWQAVSKGPQAQLAYLWAPQGLGGGALVVVMAKVVEERVPQGWGGQMVPKVAVALGLAQLQVQVVVIVVTLVGGPQFPVAAAACRDPPAAPVGQAGCLAGNPAALCHLLPSPAAPECRRLQAWGC